MQLQPHSWKREINWLWNLSYARLMQNCRHNHWTILCLFVCLFFTGQDDRLATRLMVYDATDSEAVTQLWTLEVLEFSFVSSVIFDEIENVSRLFHSAALKANNRPSNQYITYLACPGIRCFNSSAILWILSVSSVTSDGTSSDNDRAAQERANSELAVEVGEDTWKEKGVRVKNMEILRSRTFHSKQKSTSFKRHTKTK